MVSKGTMGLGILGISVLCCIAFGFVQDPAEGRFGVHVQSTNAALKSRPAMVSIVKGGEVVAQKEQPIGGYVSFDVPVGVYDVRAEGDGVVTEVKRGVQVFDRKDTTLYFDLKAGQGARIIEYAIGGITREEVATRLNKLDAEVAEIKKKIGR